MRRLRMAWRRLGGLCGREHQDGELDAEVESLLALHAEDAERRGVPPQEARALARRAFGGVAQMKDTYRDQRGLPWIDALVQDLRIALRALRRDRRVTAAVVATLALGIGANAALFGVVDAVVLKPLPYRDPDRLVWITEAVPALNAAVLDVWRRDNRSFETLGALGTQDATLGGTPALRVRVLGTTDPLARLLDVSPRLGRDFLPSDFDPSRHPPSPGPNGISAGGAAILSERLFRTRFGGDPATLDTTIVVGRFSYTVIGVMAQTFRLPMGPLNRFGIGLRRDPDVLVTAPDTTVAAAVGRLRPGVGIAAAREELRELRDRSAAAGPAPQRTRPVTIAVTPIHEQIVGAVRQSVILLWSACTFVLLIACVNVAALLLARGATRRKELAIRAALGAGRRRIARQLITESLVLACAGGMAGIVVATVGLRVLTQWSDVDVPRLADATVDWRVFLFAFGASTVAGLLTGLLPALADSRVPTGAVLADGSRSATHSKSRRRMQSMLVSAEIAAALVLMTGAGLMVKSLWLVRTQIGASTPSAVVSSRVEALAPELTRRPDDRLRFTSDLLTRVEAVPGVTAAALWNTPLIMPISVSGTPPPGTDAPLALWVSVSPHFDRAAGLRLISGRWFRHEDAHTGGVVVSESLARRLPSGALAPGDILGRTLLIGPRTQDGRSWRIVGVVSDFRTGITNGTPPDDDRGSFAQVFFPDAVDPRAGGDLLVRMSGPTDAIGPALRRLADGPPLVNVLEPQTLEGQILATIAPRSLQTTLFFLLAGLALLLALVGIGGMLWHAVTERTREIGVRMAVGADTRRILWMVMGDGARLVTVGLCGGLALSALLVPLMGALLYQVAPTDAATYVSVCGLLVAVSALAAGVPARRAMLVSPLEAMRND